MYFLMLQNRLTSKLIKGVTEKQSCLWWIFFQVSNRFQRVIAVSPWFKTIPDGWTAQFLNVSIKCKTILFRTNNLQSKQHSNTYKDSYLTNLHFYYNSIYLISYIFVILFLFIALISSCLPSNTCISPH